MGRGDWARSYRRRQGQPTRAQRRARRELWSELGVTCAWGDVLEPGAVFGREARLALDIGFGGGESLEAFAASHPDWDVLGVEVHVPGLGAALMRLKAAGLTNARVVRHDVIRLLMDHVPRGPVLSQVHLFFPEPWPREKDADRRLVRPLLLELLAERCVSGARFYLATDVAAYAEHIDRVFEGSTSTWRPCPDVGRPSWRPVSRYEEQGREAGRESHERCFERV